MGRSLIAFALASGAVCAQAQTNDLVFGSWRWSEETGAPRAAGMAGAFVALADDSSAVMLNPAGIVRVPKVELSASLQGRGSGDSLRSRTSVGYLGGSGLLTRRWGLGGFLSIPHDRRVRLPNAVPSGYLDTTVTDAGAAVSWQPSASLSLGLRLNLTHLRAQSASEVPAGPGTEALFVAVAGGRTRVAGDAGVLVDLSPEVRLGVVYRQGVSWTVDRVARSLSTGATLESERFEIHSPSSLRAGLAYRASERLLLTGQGDFVLYESMSDSTRITRGAFTRSDYGTSNALNVRAGAEVSWNVGSMSFQLRGGIAREAGGSLAYRGDDSSESQVFRTAPADTYGTVGASLVTIAGRGSELALHTAMALSPERTVFSGGLSVRF